MAKRVADFLSENNQHEEDTYREAFTLYKCRNEIVHGGSGNQSPVVQVTESSTGAQFIFNCADLIKSGYNTLRRCFRKILDDQITDKQNLLQLMRQWSQSLQRPTLQYKIVTP